MGTEHLLLGLLDIPAVAPQVLTNLGLKIEDVRQEIVRQLSGNASQTSNAQVSAPASVTYWPASAAQSVKIGGNEYRVIAAANDTGGAFSAIEGTIASADGLGMRKHAREDISVYVLDGAVRLRVQDRVVDLNKGDFSRIPRGTPHEILAAGGPSHVQLITTPGGYERALVAISQAPSIEALRDAATHYGIST